jgi:hypothetical protein
MPHYCQTCQEPKLMSPAAGIARCDTCGAEDAAAVLEPVFIVCGASGSGKTTILPELLRAVRGECIVFDVDWLGDPFSRHPGAGSASQWPVIRDVWLHVAHGVAQNGLPTLLLGPFIPEHLENLVGRRWVGDIHYLVLDCPEDERIRRLQSRPQWRLRDVDDQLAFAGWLRRNLSPVVNTSGMTPAAVADEVAAWMRTLLHSDAPP